MGVKRWTKALVSARLWRSGNNPGFQPGSSPGKEWPYAGVDLYFCSGRLSVAWCWLGRFHRTKRERLVYSGHHCADR